MFMSLRDLLAPSCGHPRTSQMSVLSTRLGPNVSYMFNVHQSVTSAFKISLTISTYALSSSVSIDVRK